MIDVSDHALIRFLERQGGLDVKSLRRDLGAALERARLAAGKVGASDYTIKWDGVVYIIKDETLVTLFDEPQKPKVRCDDHAQG